MTEHASTPAEGAADAASAPGAQSEVVAFDAPKSVPGMMEVRQLLADDPFGGWDKAWQASTTPWDLGGVTPAVAALVAAPEGSPLHLPPSIRRLLVPGCGTGYDVEAFASNGREATGLDISSSAVAHAEKRVEGAGNRAAMAFVCADFFEYRPAQPFDAIFDYTFFCALPPSLRGKWATKTAKLLAPHGVLFTLMFPMDGHEGGPPYAVSKDRCAPPVPVSSLAPLPPLFPVHPFPTLSPFPPVLSFPLVPPCSLCPPRSAWSACHIRCYPPSPLPPPPPARPYAALAVLAIGFSSSLPVPPIPRLPILGLCTSVPHLPFAPPSSLHSLS
ncbi:unnamed protein product [Closterium sp. NIES-54]